MPNEPAEHPTPATEEQRFLAQLRTHYRPAPMSPARRAVLDACVRERIERSRWRRGLMPGLLAASAAAWALWVVLPLGEEPGLDAELRVATAAVAGSPWESQLFHGDVSDTDPLSEDADADPSLPADYEAIAWVFIDE